MKDLLDKYLINPLVSALAPRLSAMIRHDLIKDFAHEVFSVVGVEDLEALVKRAKENRKTKGHSDYVDLAGFMVERRNISEK